MKVLFRPQFNQNRIEYTFGNDVITATLNDVTETFDFSELPNGIAESIKSEVFEFDPVLSAKKRK